MTSQHQSDFVDYINQKMAILGIYKSAICNFDKTNVFFHLTQQPLWKIVMRQRRKKESSQRCTVMLGVTGDGQKFPPLIIFKGLNRQMVTLEDDHLGYPLSNKYAVQDRAWMDTPTMHKWIDEVYGPWALQINGPNMVLLDLGQANAKSELSIVSPIFRDTFNCFQHTIPVCCKSWTSV
jgi:DDE superfamily endonuclease